MDSLRHLDDWLLLDVNALAHHTGWLHALLIGYARYGVLLFMVLLLAGALTARGGSARTLTAVGWACLATVLAVAVNQPVGRTFHEARPGPMPPVHSCWYSPVAPPTSPSPATARRWLVPRPSASCWSSGGWACYRSGRCC